MILQISIPFFCFVFHEFSFCPFLCLGSKKTCWLEIVRAIGVFVKGGLPVSILIRLLKFHKFNLIGLLFLGIDATSVLANEEANANKGQSIIDVDSDDDVGDVSKVIEDIREHSILDFSDCTLKF